ELRQVLHDEEVVAGFVRAVDLLLGGLANEERARLRWQSAIVLAGSPERVARAGLHDQPRRRRAVGGGRTAAALVQGKGVAKLDREDVIFAVSARQWVHLGDLQLHPRAHHARKLRVELAVLGVTLALMFKQPGGDLAAKPFWAVMRG